jgi:hypothetical protein
MRLMLFRQQLRSRSRLLLLPLLFFMLQLCVGNAATNSSAAEYASFGRAFAELAPRGEVSVEGFFDLPELTTRVTSRLPQRADTERNGRTVMRTAAENVIAGFRGTRMEYLRTRATQREHRVLIRVIGRDESLNYIELICHVGEMKQIKMVDLYSMAAAQSLVDMTERMLLLTMPPPPSLGFGRRIDSNAVRRKHIVEIVKACEAGNFRSALQKIDELPPDLQREKTFLSIRTKAAQQVGDAEFIAAARAWRVNYPKDPAVDLLSLDAFYLLKKYDLALDAVDRLDKAIGGDPHLDTFRGVLYRALGSNDLAAAALDRSAAAAIHAAQTKPVVVGRGNELLRGDANVVPASVRAAARSNSPAGFKTTTTTTTTSTNALKLQGVFIRSGSSTALISGKNVSEGDSLNGHKVVKIEQNRVTLETPQGELLKLSFQ